MWSAVCAAGAAKASEAGALPLPLEGREMREGDLKVGTDGEGGVCIQRILASERYNVLGDYLIQG